MCHHVHRQQRATRARRVMPRQDTPCSTNPCHIPFLRRARRLRYRRLWHSRPNARLSTPVSKTITQLNTRVARSRLPKASFLRPRSTRSDCISRPSSTYVLLPMDPVASLVLTIPHALLFSYFFTSCGIRARSSGPSLYLRMYCCLDGARQLLLQLGFSFSLTADQSAGR